MKERAGIVTMRGNPVVLLGNEMKIGDQAPDFTVIANDMSPVTYSSYRGKVCVVYSVPSLDTPICDMSTRRFNEEVEKLGPDVAVLTISMDLPFAQARWCGATGVKAVRTLSDHREGSFGLGFGVLMKDIRLLARAVFVVDREGKIQYVQIVPEIAQAPDFDAALEAAKKLM